MTLLTEIDYKLTRRNARDVLKNCRGLQRRYGVKVSLQSPVLTDMPRNSSNRNNVEHLMIKRFERITKAHQEKNKSDAMKLQSIVNALQSLSDISRDILYYSYCVADPYSIVKLSHTIRVYKVDEYGTVSEINYSIKNIEKLKAQALIEFAEAYQYEDLIAYKK